ncbi:Uncharacterized protein TCM_020534 [Theobroma cacao]|uniref:Uncharacterized protein n=1 Tax=Theobroma cacao TaxID=3641 RepID=A0A061EKJ6_THECC|nr:Uncharacterized protein TCM_020534 [Theobroma cacao]
MQTSKGRNVQVALLGCWSCIAIAMVENIILLENARPGQYEDASLQPQLGLLSCYELLIEKLDLLCRMGKKPGEGSFRRKCVCCRNKAPG